MSASSLIKAVVLSVVSLSLASQARAATVIADIDFESPYYALGDSYPVGSQGGLTGNLPHMLNTLVGGDFTATVADSGGASGNWLVISENGGGGYFGVFNPVAGNPGDIFFLQFSYTSLTVPGGFIGGINLIDGNGALMTGHPNNVPLYADSWALAGESMVQNQTYVLRLEVDYGGSLIRVYQDGNLITTQAAFNTDGSFGGFYFNLYNNGSVREFALDDISVGVVPEPSVVLLFCAGLGLVICLHRRRRVV